MSYKRLEILDKDSIELILSINKAKSLIEKISYSILEKKKLLGKIYSEKEEIKSNLAKNYLKANDEFIIKNGFGKARVGDKVKVVRINKKSITLEILEIGDIWKKRPIIYESDQKRIGIIFRYDSIKVSRFLFNQMEKGIKREEKLKLLNV